MAKFTATFALVFAFFILFATHEMEKGEAKPRKICQRYSKTWSGHCGNTQHCDRQCRTWEYAKHGACHRDSRGVACFCYFNC